MRFESETELAKHVVSFLKEGGWDVYAEVQVHSNSAIADIVATQGRLVWIVECKTRFGLAVIEQGARWIGRANYVSIATPNTQGRFGARVLGLFGLGMITVDFDGAQEWIAPKLMRKASTTNVRKALCEAQKTYAEPGNSHGKRWTPWARTRDSVERYVAMNPGVTMKEMLQVIETHYSCTSTARSCLYAWIRAGRFNVVLDEKFRPARLYPKGFGALSVDDEYIDSIMKRHNISPEQMADVRTRVAARLAAV